MGIDELLEKIQQTNPAADLDLVRRAYAFAEQAHNGQKRLSGGDYITHPLAVAYILAEDGLDATTIAAGLLHDVVEDTGVTLAEISRQFGPEVAQLVDGVTKLSRISYRSQEYEQVENLRKMFVAVARDLRVLLIKLADRLHNMRTLSALPPERQKAIAEETLDIFAPLAHRLGMFQLKMELEDLSLRYLRPEIYYNLAEQIVKKRAERERDIENVKNILRQKLTEASITAEVQGRAKHFYSIYKKMYEQGRELSQIYDLIAVRIIVDTVRDCYAALGVVHTLWKHVPGRFKDYITVPKSNGYQSLHTTVIGPNGEPFEIQIRTWDMHRVAEYGVAAHWRYKEGNLTDKEFDKKFAWLRQLLEWQQETANPHEYMETLKVDLFSDEVYVFTPKGDVIGMPVGATPIDFAYRIHTDIGNHCVGAKVNGRIVPLDYHLQNGEIVEIITNKASPGPSWDWLKIAKTPGAKSRIRAWFKKERREENIARGREALDREIRRTGSEPDELLREEWTEDIARKTHLGTWDDVLAAIGYGGLSAQQIAQRLRERYKRMLKETRAVDVGELVESGRQKALPPTGQGITVAGEPGMMIRFARCCNPVPGDPIVGYVTRGRGVTVHRADCPNVMHLAHEPERFTEVAWDKNPPPAFQVGIEVEGVDRPGLLSDVAKIISDTKTNIIDAEAHGGKHGAQIEVVVEVRSLDQLAYLMQRVGRVRGVEDVRRVSRDRAQGVR